MGGLYLWYAMFLGNTSGKRRGRSKPGSSKKPKRKDKQPLTERTVKDV
jgi:hypothetical protein